ncbi:type II secretion system protein [Thermospira aquatica]|uniref:Prepilin-type N-terminal cleavage/methylation domain-containing protein n=1 Tax=Thermospira aquatica TaxID=2828656 RepID=A0AAX3BAQ4_9SPIR|nr:type II secretion system protein [Thermospira aquatica]URA09297.1 prepilin-type N-terminal cleavage/methylation domain-containing protein [Thermospira aquatica]
MKWEYRLEGFTLTELLVTMTLFALVMSVVTSVLVMQLSILQRLGKAENSRELLWRHLEMVSLQTVRVETTNGGWVFFTARGRMYFLGQEPLMLMELGEKARWQYPLQAQLQLAFITNRSRGVVRANLTGIGFDETRFFPLGWQKGE